MKSIVFIATVFIIATFSCEEKDETEYPENRGDYIYSTPDDYKQIYTIHWLSDTKIGLVEYHMVVEDKTTYDFHICNSLKILDIQSKNTESVDLVDGELKYSAFSENGDYFYYKLWLSGIYILPEHQDTLRIKTRFIRLNLKTGEQLSLDRFYCDGLFCVSPDGSKLAYHKSNTDSIYVYDFNQKSEIAINSTGYPVYFTSDNRRLLVCSDLYSNFGRNEINWYLPIYEYNLESDQRQIVFSSGQVFNYHHLHITPEYLIHTLLENGHVILTLREKFSDKKIDNEIEDKFLIFNLTENKPVFCVYGTRKHSSDFYLDLCYVYDYLSNHYTNYGTNFAMDFKNRKLFYWTWECMQLGGASIEIGCTAFRRSLYCVDIASGDETRIGNILTENVSNTILSPDKTKLAYMAYYRHVFIYYLQGEKSSKIK